MDASSVGEVWYTKFPLEEDKTKFIERPAIIVGVDGDLIAVIKVTRHIPRENDEFDVNIIHIKNAGLPSPSTARVAKLQNIHISQILNRKGRLHPDDEENISNKLELFLE